MKIGLIGDHIQDIYIYGKMNRFSPESPIPIFDVIKEEVKDGGSSNVYNNLISLGTEVVYYFDKENFSIKKRFVCDNHILFRVDDDKKGNLDLKTVSFSDQIKYVILSDYNKGYLSQSQQLINILKENNKIVIVDPKKDLSNYMNSNIIKMNEFEYQRFSIKKDYQEARKYYNIDVFVITMADKGVTIVSDDGISEIEGESKQVSDVTGAGDVFIASMTYYLSKGKSIYNSCEIANKLASISVCNFGTYVITKKDLSSVEKKVIFTSGVFDLLHTGHLHSLSKSKELGNKLIVGINSDASTKRLKGENRPINNQEVRKKILESLKYVDEVIIFDEDTPYELIKKIKPDYIVKGSDYTKETVVGNDLAEVVIIPNLQGFSTTSTISKVLKNA